MSEGYTCLTCGVTGETGLGWASPTTCPKCASKEPKACPFCGCVGVWRVKSDDSKEFWLTCFNCKAHGPHVELEGLAEHEWNRRNPPLKRVL